MEYTGELKIEKLEQNNVAASADPTKRWQKEKPEKTAYLRPWSRVDLFIKNAGSFVFKKNRRL